MKLEIFIWTLPSFSRCHGNPPRNFLYQPHLCKFLTPLPRDRCKVFLPYGCCRCNERCEFWLFMMAVGCIYYARLFSQAKVGHRFGDQMPPRPNPKLTFPCFYPLLRLVLQSTSLAGGRLIRAPTRRVRRASMFR